MGDFTTGLSVYGAPILPGIGGNVFTGSVFFVDNSNPLASDNTSSGSKAVPFSTTDYAVGRCTASKGDIIFLLPGHAETVTTAITLDVIGVSIIGIGVGRLRPAITASGAIDAMNVTAANCSIQNLRFIGAAASVTAQINIAAADFTATNCVIEQDATPLMGVTVASGGHRFTFKNCLWLGTANGPDCAIDFESSASDNFIVQDCIFNFGVFGCDLGTIRANADTVEGGTIQRCLFIGVDTLAIDFNSSAGATGDGMVTDCRVVASAALTSIEDVFDVGGYNFFECYVTDVVTGRGGPVPLTTAS